MAGPGGAVTYLRHKIGGALRSAPLAFGLATVVLATGAAQVGPPAIAAGVALRMGTTVSPDLVKGGCQAGTSTCARGAASAEDLARGSWSILPSGPLQARQGQAAVWTGRELLVWGGESAAIAADGLPETMFANGAAYDVATRHWQMMAGGPLAPRQDMAVVWAGDEAVFWGGYRPVMSGYDDYANGAAYDPATATWHLLPPAPLSAGRGAEAFWTGTYVLVFGGQGKSVMDVPLAGASYDPARSTWSKLPTFPRTGPGAPISTAAVWTGHELLAVVTYEHIFPISCGKCESGYGITSRAVVAAWAPGWASWHMLASTPRDSVVAGSTYMAQATWTGREIILLGGSGCLPGMSCPPFPGPNGAAVAFDPATRSWQQLGIRVGGAGAWPSSWTGQALALLAGDGQYQGSQAPFASAGSAAAFDPATATWVPMPRAPAGSFYAMSMAWTGGQLLVWGSTSAGRNFGAVFAPGQAPGAHGYVEGTVQECVGPVGSEPQPGAVMEVEASHGGRISAVQFVEAPFHFRLELAPGRYTVSASNDVDQTVSVRSGTIEEVHLHTLCL